MNIPPHSESGFSFQWENHFRNINEQLYDYCKLIKDHDDILQLIKICDGYSKVGLEQIKFFGSISERTFNDFHIFLDDFERIGYQMLEEGFLKDAVFIYYIIEHTVDILDKARGN